MVPDKEGQRLFCFTGFLVLICWRVCQPGWPIVPGCGVSGPAIQILALWLGDFLQLAVLWAGTLHRCYWLGPLERRERPPPEGLLLCVLPFLPFSLRTVSWAVVALEGWGRVGAERSPPLLGEIIASHCQGPNILYGHFLLSVLLRY